MTDHSHEAAEDASLSVVPSVTETPFDALLSNRLGAEWRT